MTKKEDKRLNFIMYALLFVCFFTSRDWQQMNPSGEFLRLDLIKIGGIINIYYVFTMSFIFILYFKKFIRKDHASIWGEGSFIKNILFMYLIPINLLIYLTINIKDLEVWGTGAKPFMQSVTWFIFAFYAQDIFFKKKNNKQLAKILTVVEIMILIRCFYSILKYLMGFGHYVRTLGFLRMGQENDFADFFVLLFIIALTRLLFSKNESKLVRLLHVVAVSASSYILVMSARRYAWGELIVACGVILFFHYRSNRTEVNKKIILTCLIVIMILSSILVIGPGRLTENYYIGRFITVLSLIDDRFENEFGAENLHRSEIEEGWQNVKKHWLLGVTPMGAGIMERKETDYRTKTTFVHNAYISIWLSHGLFGVILFMALYVKSLQLAHVMFFKLKNETGLILLTFLTCQTIKNIIWPTIIEYMNLTIIFIFLSLFVLRTKQLILLENVKKETQDTLDINTA